MVDQTDVMVEFAKQIPALGVLVWLVIYFLRHLEKIGNAHADRMREVVSDYREVAKENTSLFRRVLEALGRLN